MLTIEPLLHITPAEVGRLIHGYTSRQRYEVTWHEAADRTTFDLHLVDLPEVFEKRWHHEHMTDWYRGLFGLGLSFGAWNDGLLIGLAITERRWNDEAMVWEIHVADSHRGEGIGRRLLQAVETAARSAGIRSIVVETQTPNVPAIGFYRACGYSLQAFDLSFYANDDHDRGEVAVFMKKAL